MVNRGAVEVKVEVQCENYYFLDLAFEGLVPAE